MFKYRLKNLVLTIIFVISLIAIVFVWEYLVVKYEVPKRILPKPSDIFTYLQKEFFGVHNQGYETILTKTLQSFFDALIGFMISIVIGTIVGVILSRNEVLRLCLKPFVFITQLLPVPAFAPIIAAIFGYDIETKLIIIVIFTIFPVIITVEKAINSIPSNLMNLFRVYNASRFELLSKLVLPSIIPTLLVNAKILCTASFVTSIIAELPLTVSGGIGKDIFNSFNNQVNVRVWASMVVISIISILFFEIVSKSEQYILDKYGYGKYEQ